MADLLDGMDAVSEARALVNCAFMAVQQLDGIEREAISTALDIADVKLKEASARFEAHQKALARTDTDAGSA